MFVPKKPTLMNQSIPFVGDDTVQTDTHSFGSTSVLSFFLPFSLPSQVIYRSLTTGPQFCAGAQCPAVKCHCRKSQKSEVGGNRSKHKLKRLTSFWPSASCCCCCRSTTKQMLTKLTFCLDRRECQQQK